MTRPMHGHAPIQVMKRSVGGFKSYWRYKCWICGHSSLAYADWAFAFKQALAHRDKTGIWHDHARNDKRVARAVAQSRSEAAAGDRQQTLH